MANWYDMRAMQMSKMIAEDVWAPELRNPRYTAIRQRKSNWFTCMLDLWLHNRLLKRK